MNGVSKMWPFDDVLGGINELYLMIISIPTMVLYPFLVAAGMVQDWILAGYAGIVGFINVIIQTPNTIIDFVNLLFVNVLPALWLQLIAIHLMVIVGLRLYSYAKDVSIVGFKI